MVNKQLLETIALSILRRFPSLFRGSQLHLPLYKLLIGNRLNIQMSDSRRQANLAISLSQPDSQANRAPA